LTCHKGSHFVDKLRTPEEALELIEYLVLKGKRPNSFENVFPRIHHFKGRTGTLRVHLEYIKGPDAVKAYTSKTNQNVVRRMERIKSLVDDFFTANPNSDAISAYGVGRINRSTRGQLFVNNGILKIRAVTDPMVLGIPLIATIGFKIEGQYIQAAEKK
jgi:hypothetical protein